MENSDINKSYFWSMVLLTPIGGISFPIVRLLLTVLVPFELLSFRLGLGGLILILCFPKRFFKANKQEIKGGLVSGLFFGGAMALLVYGLQTTGGGQAAFILSTQVVLVPIIRLIGWQDHLSSRLLSAIGLCSIGLVVLTYTPGIGFRLADIWILSAAVCVAFFAISNSHFNGQENVKTLPMGIWQISTAGFAMFLLANLTGSPTWQVPMSLWGPLAFLVLISTSFRYIIQLKLQSKLSATLTGLIFTLEPVWATVFSFIWLKESMSMKELLGSIVIFIGIYIAKSSPKVNSNKYFA